MSFQRHSDFATPAQTARQTRGFRAYHSGVSAEQSVERHYVALGYSVATRRHRNAGGELDLVLRLGATVIFVEVKKAHDFARAAERVSPRQIARLQQAAAGFLAGEPMGELTDCRFDVALVNQSGEIEILENALMGF